MLVSRHDEFLGSEFFVQLRVSFRQLENQLPGDPAIGERQTFVGQQHLVIRVRHGAGIGRPADQIVGSHFQGIRQLSQVPVGGPPRAALVE
jgi:hypothetical protein